MVLISLIKILLTFIDTLTYYQENHSQLSSAATYKKKSSIKKLKVEFFQTHDNFHIIWKNLDKKLQEKILDLIATGKGIIQ